jgi:hypothetical protein
MIDSSVSSRNQKEMQVRTCELERSLPYSAREKYLRNVSVTQLSVHM